MFTAEIISIGDEILFGQTVNTNAAWMGERLSEIGLPASRITTISDDPSAIKKALQEASNRAQVVLVTGGLGPTQDDRTKACLVEIFGGELIESKQVINDITDLFYSRGLPMNDLNRQQALVPSSCTIIRNQQGTAPGLWFERDQLVLVAMPGVPYEMKAMMSQEILSRIKQKFDLPVIRHKLIMTTGVPESRLAERIKPWEDSIPEHLSVAYLPSPGIVKLRLTGKGNQADEIDQDLNDWASRLIPYLPDHLYDLDGLSLEEKVGKLLVNYGCTVSTAESCSGGYLAHLLSRHPGSSRFYTGSIIAYSNSIKTKYLGISQQILASDGAVSEPVVKQMAREVREQFQTDYGLATSGIAGPDGGTPDKPVGTIWIAVSSRSHVQATQLQLGQFRDRNIIRSCMAVMNMLRLQLLQDFSHGLD